MALGISTSIGCSDKPIQPWKQRKFFITFWLAPPANEEALSRASSEGFNLSHAPLEDLDTAEKYNVSILLQSSLLQVNSIDDEIKRKKLDALIYKVKNHPALEGYILTDEPGSDEFNSLGRLVGYLRDKDPGHFAYINLLPTYATDEQLKKGASASGQATLDRPTDFEGAYTDNNTAIRYQRYLDQFIATVKPDLLSYDHYHFLKKPDGSPCDGKQYFLNLELIRNAALKADKPFLNIIQANTIEKNWRLPSPNELRWLVFTTLAYGGKGISYFTYWGPKSYNGLYQDGHATPLLEYVSSLNKELEKIGSIILDLKSVAVYHTGSLPYGSKPIPENSPVLIDNKGEFVLGIFNDRLNNLVFMITNRNYSKESSVGVSFPIPVTDMEELDRKTGTWRIVSLSDSKGKAVFKLSPGDGRLFRIQSFNDIKK